MKTLIKKNEKFIILNLTDPQVNTDMWKEQTQESDTFIYTTKELVERVKPDLITITGDFCLAGQYESYRCFAEFLNSFDIPFTFVWGNHDNQSTDDVIEKQADIFISYKNCLFEKGDKELGSGNYVLAIQDEKTKKIVQGLIFMDTHDREEYVSESGEMYKDWARLNNKQLKWYKKQVEKLKEQGCTETSLFIHIPIYAYRQALNENAKKETIDKIYDWNKTIKYDWWVCNRVNPLYKKGYCNIWNGSSNGELNEELGATPQDDGVFKIIKEENSTKNIFVGHNHMNAFTMNYQGVNLHYCLKTGTGCYFADTINGGTSITIDNNGVKEVRREYIEISNKILRDIYIAK